MDLGAMLSHPGGLGGAPLPRPAMGVGSLPRSVPMSVDTAYLDGLDIKKEIERLITAGRTPERIEKERDWFINWQWFRGFPYFRKNFSSGKIDFVDFPDRQFIKAYNLIRPRVRTLVGNETFVPKFRARKGAAMGTDDEMRRRGVEDVCNHGCRAARLAARKRKADLWKHIWGHIWFHVFWDPTKGPLGPVTGEVDCQICKDSPQPGTVTGIDGGSSPCPQCTVQVGDQQLPPGKVMGPRGMGPQGEVAIDVCAPWEVLCDTSARDMPDIRWLIRERLMDRQQAWETYAKKAGIPIEKIQKQDTSQSIGMTNFMTGPDGRRVGSASDVTLVRELWMLPTEKHPNGVYGCVVGNVVCHGGRNPWEHQRIPYVPYRCREDPACFFPSSTVDDLVPVNSLFNDTMTKLHEHMDMGLVQRLMVPENVGVTYDDIPGIMRYEYKPSYPKPEYIQAPAANQDTSNLVQMMEKYADEQSSVSDAMRGQIAQDDPNAEFAAFVEQRSVTPIRDIIEDNADSLTQVGQLVTATVKLMYDQGRLLDQVWGGGGGQVMMEVFDAGRAGDPNVIELIPERDIGRTLASRRKEVLEAAKGGVMQDPRLMKLMEYADEDDVYQDMILDEEVAAQEVKKIQDMNPQMLPPPMVIMTMPTQTQMMMQAQQAQAMGMMPPPMMQSPLVEAKMWMDHEIHVRVKRRELNRFRVTFPMKEADPRCAILERNILDHSAMLQIEMGMTQQRMMDMASQYGLANAAGPAAAPGGAPAPGGDQSAVVAQGQPGPPGSQPALAQASEAVDAAVKNKGGAA